MYLTEADILGANDLPEIDVTVPEWPGKNGKPGTVRVRCISMATQQHIRNISRDAKGEIDQNKVELAMLVACMVEPKLSESAIEKLRDKRASAIGRIVRAIAELNGTVSAAGESAEATFLPGTGEQAGGPRNDGKNPLVSGNGIALQDASAS